MTDRYEEWRDFYAEKVRSWMSLEELRAECGKLTTTDGTSPEVLLIHAMHALEECVQRNEALLEEVAEWKRVASAQAELHGESEARAEGMEKALKDIRSLSSINSAMNPNSFALTVLLADIHHIADTALSKENTND